MSVDEELFDLEFYKFCGENPHLRFVLWDFGGIRVDKTQKTEKCNNEFRDKRLFGQISIEIYLKNNLRPRNNTKKTVLFGAFYCKSKLKQTENTTKSNAKTTYNPHRTPKHKGCVGFIPHKKNKYWFT